MEKLFFSLTFAALAVTAFGQLPNLADTAKNSASFNMFDSGMKAAISCLNMAESNDKWLGKLALKPELYCTPATYRVVPGMTCCTPQNTTDFDLKFMLYLPGQKGFKYIDFYDKKGKDIMAKQKGDLVFLITGFMETIKISPWINQTRDGFLKRGNPVIMVDWSKGNQIQYWQAIANLRTVGEAIGHAIVKWDIIDKVIVSGLSLGGQVVGEVGKYVREKTGKLIKECHAFDPAGPFFDGGHNDMILDKGDCKVVQVIHTSAAQSEATSLPELMLVRLGTAKKSGHCDFWVNCGHMQEKQCSNPDIGGLMKTFMTAATSQSDEPIGQAAFKDSMCSHVRSATLYTNSVMNKCKYQSYKCPNCGPGPAGDMCTADGPAANSFPPNSKCDSSMDVNYMMKTTSSGNFCSMKP